MSNINETVRTVNSAVRTLILLVLVVGAGFVGWKGYVFYYEPQKQLAEKELELEQVRDKLADRTRALDDLSKDLKERTEQLERSNTKLKLLKLNHRIAHLEVVEQKKDPGTKKLVSTIEFFEVNDEGAPISERTQRFEIIGDRVYVDCLVAKFEDKYIEEADLDRATAICSFQRIFGEHQQPQDGFVIDRIGSSPTSYERGGQVSEFEQRIWDDFWNIANDRTKAAEIGIRAAHANAPSIRVRKGQTYELELRSTGEFTLSPMATPKQRDK